MSDACARAHALLDDWRASGADRLDPARFRALEALLRRAQVLQGEARSVLDATLSGWLDAYAARVARAGASRAEARPAAAGAVMPGPLAALVDYVAAQPRAEGIGLPARAPAGGARAFPEPALLDYFRETWSRVSTERQLRTALDQVPKNAGPLNSSSLVHRALTQMHALSPAYLRQFLSYVDALSWLEQATGERAPAADEPAAKRGGRGGRAR
ncbi:DUF2894 domain-containing protein [Burkholderia sp. FERM BP-3421]|uniref:DUF2894 domain-containing protein n=1 Tax=Burkholderia sp. FERM BP-3421 TaxID=1494466 RepID=UPI0023617489|nr:DUF2894 domain-containing protein [Burkholderia sp. FERM BP-3421]WDD91633.1 DUF2894 domain-containing protein [Burkholderia sp. FERM BP-3421]